jgi:hypothetical protein
MQANVYSPATSRQRLSGREGKSRKNGGLATDCVDMDGHELSCVWMHVCYACDLVLPLRPL